MSRQDETRRWEASAAGFHHEGEFLPGFYVKDVTGTYDRLFDTKGASGKLDVRGRVEHKPSGTRDRYIHIREMYTGLSEEAARARGIPWNEPDPADRMAQKVAQEKARGRSSISVPNLPWDDSDQRPTNSAVRSAPLNETLQPALLADSNSMIANRTFDGDTLVGPAVIVLLEDVKLDGITFETDADALFIVIPQGSRVVGVIGLKNVELRNCTFQNIAIAGTPEDIARFRQALQVTS